MTSFTYSTLETAIKDFVEDDGDELDAAIDNIMDLAQCRVARDLDLEIFRTVANGTIALSARFLSLPSDCIMVNSLWISVSGTKTRLGRRTVEYCEDYAPDASVEDQPAFFSEYDTSQVLLAPVSDASYSYTLYYLKRPSPLSASNTTTWISTHAGDLLFYACLIETENFLMESSPELVQQWKNGYIERLAVAKPELSKIARKEHRVA